MSELETRLARCERHIADLTLRIASLKEGPVGTGLIGAHELVALLEQTLESWQEAKRTLLQGSRWVRWHLVALDADRDFTIEAHTVTLTPDGDLQIRGQNLGKSFSAGLWDGVEIKTIPITFSG
jgi:hypothetical protein